MKYLIFVLFFLSGCAGDPGVVINTCPYQNLIHQEQSNLYYQMLRNQK